MIPTMLVVGFAVGAMVHDDRSLVRMFMFGAGASVLWGIVVGVGASSPLVALGGAGVGLINVATGALIGWALRSVFVTARTRVEPPGAPR